MEIGLILAVWVKGRVGGGLRVGVGVRLGLRLRVRVRVKGRVRGGVGIRSRWGWGGTRKEISL
jgi:hypothetical protein